MTVFSYLKPPSSYPPLNIAIIRTSSIGDVVLSSVCFEFLKHLEVPVQVLWLGKMPSLGLLKQSFSFVSFMDLGASLEDVVHILGECHMIIDLQCNARSHWLSLQFQYMYKRPVYRLDKKSLARYSLLAKAYVRGRRSVMPYVNEHKEYQFKHMLKPICVALKEAGYSESMIDSAYAKAVPQLYFDPMMFANIVHFRELSLGAWIAVAPGASWPAKQAPLSVFRNILLGLEFRLKTFKRSLGVMCLGDGHDSKIIKELWNCVDFECLKPIFFAGKLTLPETGYALSFAKATISNDSGLAHLSESVNTPVAVLFGPTVEAFGFAPRMKQSKSFSSDLGCRPCSKHGQIACRFKDQRCFHDVSVDKVVEHIWELIL